MDGSLPWLLAAVSLVGLFAGGHLALRRRRQSRDQAALAAKTAARAHVARSLHPVIDPDVCMGSLSCLKACPEGDILGVVNGAAHLVHADHCIGHGRCAAECPVGAIRLVFGSAERGVDLPEVDEWFESSRRGVHVVGELGGMGLIRNAIVQGLEVAERLAAILPKGQGDAVGVVIVGAGPAGLAAALGLRAAGVPFRVLDQGTLGGSIAHYPRQKVAMTEPVDLPLAGRFGKKLITKEELLASWNRALAKAQVRVEEGVKVTGLAGEDGRFVVATDRGPVPAAKVVLATGRRGTPRRLGAPGEDLPKVAYGLVDPEQYDGKRVLVVGGGDAALEAAIQLAERSRAEVAISYRGDAFARCREANRAKIEGLGAAKRVEILLRSQVTAIREREVELAVGDHVATLDNDYVIVSIGGELPLEFLANAGVSVRRYHGEAPARPSGAGTSGAGAGARAALAGTRAARDAADRRRRRAVRVTYAAVGLALLAALAWVGQEYYPLARAARLRHAQHALLKPAGAWGHGIGIAATVFMLSNFLYAVRKRWRRMTGLGPISGWLDFHVFVGFMSPLVIAFHAAFQSNNGLATATAASLAVVVGTGLVGRFIYGAVPTERGKSVELAELLGRFERLRDEAGPLLREAGGAAEALLARASAPVTAGSLPVLFVRWPAEAIALRLRLARLRRRFRDPARYRMLRTELLALVRLRWQIRFYASLKGLLRGWRVLHASLAGFLVIAITAHIALSLYLGYGLLRR
jgi:thioredoxin reductase/Pyruvate/2-oxoacid:ferredoxin oxidoreductase delta subunit